MVSARVFQLNWLMNQLPLGWRWIGPFCQHCENLPGEALHYDMLLTSVVRAIMPEDPGLFLASQYRFRYRAYKMFTLPATR